MRRQPLARATSLLTVFLALALPALARAKTYANFNRSAYGYTSQLTPAQEASRYQVMVLQSSDAPMVRVLKAANPSLKIFMYEGIQAAVNAPTSGVTCTAGPWVEANHPNWILTDQNGNQILYQGHYLVDVGNTAYQQTCLQNVIPLAKQGGFDGVYWDMVNMKLSWTLPANTSVPEYPTDPSWQAAMYSMLSYAGGQLHSNGLMNIANIGGGIPSLWQQWNGPLDGAEEESWTDGKQGLLQQVPNWKGKLNNAAWSEANGKILILHSWNTTHTGNIYGLAAMMLIANGEASYSTSNSCYSTCEVWYPEYTTAQQLGAPLGSYTILADGAYERRFQNGMVVVNPTANTIAAAPLGGGTYSGSGLSNVSNVDLPPTSGFILLTDAPPPTSPPSITSPPTIAGSPSVGATLTASLPGIWSPGWTIAYQWESCPSSNAASCTPIPGAVNATYTVTASDVGNQLAVIATVTNAAGSASASSGETIAVPSNPVSRVASGQIPQTVVQQGGATVVIAPTSRGYAFVARLDPRHMVVRVGCPRELRHRCRFAITMIPAPASATKTHTGARPVKLGTGTLTLRPGKAGTLRITLTAAARRMVAHGKSVRVEIRVLVRYGGKLTTLVFFTRLKPPARPRHH